MEKLFIPKKQHISISVFGSFNGIVCNLNDTKHRLYRVTNVLIMPFLVLFIFLYSNNALGQLHINFYKGYVITLNNDTIHGLINDGGGISNSNVCIFKAGQNNQITKYYPGDIKAYRFVGDKYYCSKEIVFKNQPKKVFLEVLLDGDYDLYYYWKNNNGKYYIESDQNTYVLSHEMRKMNKRDAYNQQKPLDTWIETGNYKDSLFVLFSDCPNVQSKVDGISYNRESIVEITKSYLNEKCKEKNCIRYEKNYNASRPYFGVFTGLQVSQMTYWESLHHGTEGEFNEIKQEFDNKILVSVPFGLLYNFPLTLINEQLSFQMEAITSTFKHTQPSLVSMLDTTYTEIDVDAVLLEFPLMLKYKLGKNISSPTIALGKSTNLAIYSKHDKLFNIQKGGWFAEVGYNYRLSPRLSLFSNIRVQKITSMVIDDSRLNNQSFSHSEDNFLYRHKFENYIATLYLGINF